MSGHALLVGCPRESRRGSEHDVLAMQAMLEKRGFATKVYVGDAATREQILDGYDQLIAAVGPDDAAVFYYTGHGFEGFSEAAPTRSWQGICPVDTGKTTEDDFRWITSFELSLKLARLTRRTRNATVILDCCYASQMSRDAAAQHAVPRAIPHPMRRGFQAHLEALRAQYPDVFDTVGALDNPDAVRLVACGQDESAYEYPGSDGEYRGVFTEALLDVLGELAGAPVSWAAIYPSIRTRVMGRFSLQHPGIEGPADRLLFSLASGGPSGAVALIEAADGYRLLAGGIMGVAVGDVFGVMPSGSTAYRADCSIAELDVSDVAGTMANVTVRGPAGSPKLPVGAIAFPIKKAAVRHAVAIDVPDAAREQVARAVAATATLRLAEPQEPTILPTLRLTGDGLTIADRIGPLFPVARFPEELPLTIQNLANLGAAQGLRALEGEHGVRADELEVEWGTVDSGQMRRMPDRGGALGLRDRLYVRVRTRAQRPLFVHLFNIGVRGKITRLTSVPTGVQLHTRQPARPEYVFGQAPDGTITGVALRWPERLPRDTPGIDEVVVIATARVTDLQDLETIEQLAQSRSAASGLRALLAQLHAGGTRSVSAPEEHDEFFVKRLMYRLHPRDADLATLPFELDDDPLRDGATRLPEAWLSRQGAAPPSDQAATVAIRLAEFVVKTAGILPPGRRNIRLDALISTRSQRDVRYAAWTRRWPGFEPGAPLPLYDDVVFRDPVSDFVELQLWISADTGAPDLADLLAERANRGGARSSDDDGVAAPWLAAAESAAVLARAANRALRDSTSVSIGVYRTCVLVRELSGKHGQIAEERLSTPNFSFAMSITIDDAGDAHV